MAMKINMVLGKTFETLFIKYFEIVCELYSYV